MAESSEGAWGGRAARALGSLVLIALLAPAWAGGQETAVAVFLPSVRVSGEPRERGRAYGELYREGIRGFLEREIWGAFEGRPASREELLAYAAACGAIVKAECPLIAEELAGIAEGAGLTFEELVLINLHEELYHRTDLPKSGHCTAVAVGPPDTADQRTYVGQTWDWMQSVAGMSAVTEWQRDDGTSVLAYGFPGMPMGAGLNEHGIALCWTSAALGQPGQTARIGIPSYTLIAHLLAQKDLEGVIREARKDKHAGWFTFVMADGQGNLLNIEGSPAGVAIEASRGRLARVGYGSREMTGTADGDSPPVHPRCRQVYALLDHSPGKNDLESLQAYFADPGHGINQGPATIDLMVFDTSARAAYLSRGTAYGLDWRTFTFSPPTAAPDATSDHPRRSHSPRNPAGGWQAEPKP